MSIIKKMNKNPTPVCTHYTRKMAESVRSTSETMFPRFDSRKVKLISRRMDFWDGWFVTDVHGNIANVGGYKVMVGLGRLLSSSSHPRLVYFYSRDDDHYVEGGPLLPTPLIKDAKEWSGSTILRPDGTLQTFYTIVNTFYNRTGRQNHQRIATAIQKVHADSRGLRFSAPTFHDILFGPDGKYYQTIDQAWALEEKMPTRNDWNRGSALNNNFCFRDPKFVFDEDENKAYLLFEANTGPRSGDPENTVKAEYVGGPTSRYQATADALKANGCVGVAELHMDNVGVRHLTRANLLPPLLTTNLVTDEIERINAVKYDNYWYLFCVTHTNKWAFNNPSLMNRDIMLGFRSRHLMGPYEPLNGNGVVVQQYSPGKRQTAVHQNRQRVYSWLLLSDMTITSYADYGTNQNGQLIKQRTVAPSVALKIDGLRTKITKVLYNVNPA